MATSRGKPNFNGLEKIHRKVIRKIGGEAIESPLCYNGAWNLRWTKFDKEVTCPACLKEINKWIAK